MIVCVKICPSARPARYDCFYFMHRLIESNWNLKQCQYPVRRRRTHSIWKRRLGEYIIWIFSFVFYIVWIFFLNDSIVTKKSTLYLSLALTWQNKWFFILFQFVTNVKQLLFKCNKDFAYWLGSIFAYGTFMF